MAILLFFQLRIVIIQDYECSYIYTYYIVQISLWAGNKQLKLSDNVLFANITSSCSRYW